LKEMDPSSEEAVEARCPVCGSPMVQLWDSVSTGPIGWQCGNPRCPSFMQVQLEAVWTTRKEVRG